MAATLLGVEYIVTGTAVSLTSALGFSPSQRFVSHVTFRANDTNVGNVYLGRSNVTAAANRLVLLKPGESFSFGLESAFASTDEWFIVGTAADLLHIVGLA